MLDRATKKNDTCIILVDYDILGDIKALSFVNQSGNEKCSLNW